METLTEKQIEAAIKATPLHGKALSIFRMAKLYSTVKNRAGAKPEIALNRVWKLTRGEKFDFAFAEYIYKTTRIMVEIS